MKKVPVPKISFNIFFPKDIEGPLKEILEGCELSSLRIKVSDNNTEMKRIELQC